MMYEKFNEAEKRTDNFLGCVVMVFALAVLTIAFIVGSSFAGDYEIRTKYNDYNPGDGFFEAGTQSNPYVIKNDYNETIAEIKPRYTDFTPGDGFNDAGSNSNPYIIKWGDDAENRIKIWR